jgi:signal-transduction protein with cAMP-binding, CBS, and nucleotidyltransferase domain
VFTDLRLQSQLRAVETGRPPSNVVSMDELTTSDRSRLSEAFRVVRVHQQATELHFHTDVVT